MKEYNIALHRLPRIEGHGNVILQFKNGNVEEVRWEITESPRFFEPMLVGKMWDTLPWLCSRICGICSIGHALASIRAIEQAFGYHPPQQTRKLRLLLKHMETLQSHVLHIFFLVMPDFLEQHSVLPFRTQDPELLNLAIRLKKTANDGADLIGGRRLHPTRPVVGGFTMVPERQQLQHLLDRLAAAQSDIHDAADRFQAITFPDFLRETEYVSLKSSGAYPFIGGTLSSSEGVERQETDYLEMTNEYHVNHSTARWSRLCRESFMVGALARINNNGSWLRPKAAAMADRFKLRPHCCNPFKNSLAQLVECMHVVEDSMFLIDDLLGQDTLPTRSSVHPRAGTGTGAVEVPRGILYHSYTFDGDGRVIGADCVIPTSQNHANIQKDLEHLASEALANQLPEQEVRKLAAMLVRAYDPCVSCSVH